MNDQIVPDKPKIRLHCPGCGQYTCRLLFGRDAIIVGAGDDPMTAWLDWLDRIASSPETARTWTTGRNTAN